MTSAALRRPFPLPLDILGGTPDLVFHCNDGVYTGVSSLFLASSKYLRDIATIKKTTPQGDYYCLDAGVEISLPSACILQMELLADFLTLGRIEATQTNTKYLRKILKYIRVDLLNLHTDIVCEQKPEKIHEGKMENLITEDLNTSIEIFEFKPTIKQELTEVTIESNAIILQTTPDCSESTVSTSTEQALSNSLNPFVEDNDLFLENNGNRNFNKHENLISSDNIRTIYDEDEEDYAEIVIDDNEDENDLMDNDDDVCLDNDEAGDNVESDDEEIVLGDTSDEDMNHAFDEDTKSTIKINNDSDSENYTSKDLAQLNENTKDPNYDPSEECVKDDVSAPSCPSNKKRTSSSYIDENVVENYETISDCRIPCDMCDKDFERVEEYLSHKLNICSSKTLNSIRCPLEGCSYSVSKYRNMYSHALNNMCDHIRAKHSREASFQCKQCSKKCFSRKSFVYHCRQHTDMTKYYCKKCEHFIKNTKFEEHEVMHEKNVFKCDQCPKTFLRFDRLFTHKPVHDEHKYPCTKCKKKFHQKNNLKVHMERKHGFINKTVHTCDICNEYFHKVNELKSHRKREHDIENALTKQFKCTSCLKVFGRKGNLRNHMKECKRRKIKEKWTVLAAPKETQE